MHILVHYFNNYDVAIYRTTTEVQIIVSTILIIAVAAGIIAACWAAMVYYGREGYVNSTKAIIATAKAIEKG